MSAETLLNVPIEAQTNRAPSQPRWSDSQRATGVPILICKDFQESLIDLPGNSYRSMFGAVVRSTWYSRTRAREAVT